MEAIVIGVVAVISVVIFWSISSTSAPMTRLSNSVSGAAKVGRVGLKWMYREYLRNIQPQIRNLGIAAVLAFIGMAIGVWYWVDDPSIKFIPIIISVISAVLLGSLIWLRTPRTFSTFSLANVLIGDLILTGGTFFVAGLLHANRSIIVLGATLLVCAKFTAKLEASFFVGVGVFATNVVEGVLSFGARIVQSFVDKENKLGLVKPDGVDILPEHTWKPKVDKAFKEIDDILYPLLAIGVLSLSPTFTGFFVVAGLVSHLVWGKLEARGIVTDERRKSAALLFELLSYALIVLVALTLFVPKFQAAFDLRRVQVLNWVPRFVKGEVGIPFMDRATSLIFLAVGALGAGYIFFGALQKDDVKFAGTLRSLGAFCALLAFFGLIGTFAAYRTKNKDGSVLTLGGMRSDAMNAPHVWRDGNRVMFTWTDAPDAVSYRLERRESHEKTFTKIVDGLTKGITKWESDTSALGLKEGHTYFIRAIAVYAPPKKVQEDEVVDSQEPAPESDPSPEVELVMPAAHPLTWTLKPQPSTTNSSKVKATGTVTAPPAITVAAAKPAAKPCNTQELPQATLAMCVQLGIPCD